MQRIVDGLSRIFLRWVPDSFVVAVALTLLTWILAVAVAGYGAAETITAWGDGFWNLLKFTNQITLTLLLGYTLANTPPVRRLLLWIAGRIGSARAAYRVACVLTGFASLLSWGLGLIVAGITARAIGESCRRRGVLVHYPLLVASAFSGFVIWHQGLSASVSLTLATPGHFLEDQVGLVPIGETIFSAWNWIVVAVVLIGLPFVMSALAPKEEETYQIPEHLMGSGGESGGALDVDPESPAGRLERSPILMALFVIAGLFYIYTHFVIRGQGLTLDIFNFCFLIGGIVLAGSLIRYLHITLEGGRIAVPFLLQYPLYSGVAAVMAASGLAAMLIELFAGVASPETLPFYAFFSGGLLNLFVPSGGGQWAVQGPIMMGAAQELGADLARTALGVSLGDQWTNLVQPLAVVPVLAIAGIELRRILAYCLFALAFSGLVFTTALLLF